MHAVCIMVHRHEVAIVGMAASLWGERKVILGGKKKTMWEKKTTLWRLGWAVCGFDS